MLEIEWYKNWEKKVGRWRQSDGLALAMCTIHKIGWDVWTMELLVNDLEMHKYFKSKRQQR